MANARTPDATLDAGIGEASTPQEIATHYADIVALAEAYSRIAVTRPQFIAASRILTQADKTPADTNAHITCVATGAVEFSTGGRNTQPLAEVRMGGSKSPLKRLNLAQVQAFGRVDWAKVAADMQALT